MSGHSKVRNIKHKKEKNDAAKGKVFTLSAVRLPLQSKRAVRIRTTTAVFAMLLQKQKQINMLMIRLTVVSSVQQEMRMPLTTSTLHMKDMDRAESLLLLEALTDNKNRTASNVT